MRRFGQTRDARRRRVLGVARRPHDERAVAVHGARGNLIPDALRDGERLAGDVLRAHGHLREQLDGLHAALPDGRRRLALRREHLVEGEREGVPLLGEGGVEGSLSRRHHRDDAEQRARAGDARGDAGSRGTASILLRQRPRGLRAVARGRDGGGDERRGFAHRARYTLVLASTRVPSAERIRKRSVR